MAAAEPLTVQNCVTLRPTMEEFRDELKFLASDAVQAAGKKCGIVRVVTPEDFQPTREPHTKEEKEKDPKLWSVNVPVLEQQFLKVTGRDKSVMPGQYIIGLRQFEPYDHPAAEWKDIANTLQDEAEEAVLKHLNRIDPDPRRHFWESRPYHVCAAYAPDIPQSNMKADQDCWNFSSDTFPCLTRMFKTDRTPGVYTPYLYLGSWGTAFGLHPEDKDLYSLNFLHEGESKFWYGMPQSWSPAVEAFAAEIIPKEARECSQFLRHKTLLIEPRYFLDRGIPVFAAEQKEGDLIITFPNAYHYGFNNGFNIAEARNIATVDWLDYGLKAKQCTCPKYKTPDVLPRRRIVAMAKHVDRYKYLTVPENPEKNDPHRIVKRQRI